MGDPPDDLAALQRAGSGRFADVRVFSEVDSTNTVVLAEAAAGAADGTVVVADHQRAGRGRLGRTWDAEAGSALLVSVLVRHGFESEQVPVLTLVAGCEMAATVEDLCAAAVRLKWPNDLRIGDRKLGGVLAEARSDAPGALVIGIGVNVTDGALPPDVAAGATSLQDAGVAVARADLLGGFLGRLEARLAAFGPGPEVDSAALEAFLAEYASRCETLGAEVAVRLHTTGAVVVEGTAVRVDEDGALVVAIVGGDEVAVSHGEVEQLR